MIKTWRFNPLDTWFFRESRPHGVVGGSELGSLFPPPARTLAGAVRTLMGQSFGVDWTEFKNNIGRGRVLREQIGYGEEMGQLRLSGPWLLRTAGGREERLYPAPAFLMRATEAPDDPTTTKQEPPALLSPLATKAVRLQLGAAVVCDLGRVPLPILPSESFAKPLRNAWLTRAGLQQTLAGKCPERNEIFIFRQDLAEEPRLGIARDNATRTPLQGLLYQTRHLRLSHPSEELAVEVDVEIPDPDLHHPESVGRLGGEGRMATVQVHAPEAPFPRAPKAEGQRWLALCLLSAADLGGQWWPPGLHKAEDGGNTVWRGAFQAHKAGGDIAVPLTLRAAILPKAGREGGWDLATGKPRAVRSLLPAGSVWLCTVDDGADATGAIEALHGTFVGAGRALGRGQLAVGIWNNPTSRGAEAP